MKLAKADSYNRRGPVRYVVHETGPGQPVLLNLGIAYDEAPVPEHYYVADYYQIIPQDFDVLLIFGKLDHPAIDRLRNKIEIYFAVQSFVRQLWYSSRDFQDGLEKYVAQNKAQALMPSAVSAQTEKVQTLHSNNALIVHSSGDCILDFFYISPKDLWIKPAKREAIELEALVRVLAPASLVLGFLREVDRVSKDLVTKLEIKLEDENAVVESK